jgi:hypothetical protein
MADWDWVTISALITGAGTLVLALATFASVRSSNRAARVAERALLAQQRPVLAPSRDEDPPERIMYGDRHWVTLTGHGAVFEAVEDRVYMALPLRNVGLGIAVIHGWTADCREITGIDVDPPELDRFRRQTRDLYVPAGGTGFWQAAIRDPQDPDHAEVLAGARQHKPLVLHLLYGDHEGGQRTIARFTVLTDDEGDGLISSVNRYWNVDREDPR